MIMAAKLVVVVVVVVIIVVVELLLATRTMTLMGLIRTVMVSGEWAMMGGVKQWAVSKNILSILQIFTQTNTRNNNKDVPNPLVSH